MKASRTTSDHYFGPFSSDIKFSPLTAYPCNLHQACADGGPCIEPGNTVLVSGSSLVPSEILIEHASCSGKFSNLKFFLK